ncbi:MAG: sulfurtransferase [Gemmatimonadetes bacterium]|nr:sulfurtransferase [Gemmatimonadota bacterium]
MTALPPGARGYARPDVLVTTAWVQDHLQDPGLRILECDEDPLLYDAGHIPGACRVDWHEHLNDPIQRDYLDRERLQQLLRGFGVGQDTVVVLYGDQHNWWAAFAFWIFSLFGLSRLRLTQLKLLDGGRRLWEEEGRPLSVESPRFAVGDIVIGERNDRLIRAFRQDVLEHVFRRSPLVDVRSPAEFDGRRLHMPEYPNEGAVRGGRIPGARNIPWERSVDRATLTFKPAAELRAIYQEEHGLHPDADVVTYCRIGERSALTWFVLTYLLGFNRVRNYDGSWTEWGNSVRLPIER